MKEPFPRRQPPRAPQIGKAGKPHAPCTALRGGMDMTWRQDSCFTSRELHSSHNSRLKQMYSVSYFPPNKHARVPFWKTPFALWSQPQQGVQNARAAKEAGLLHPLATAFAHCTQTRLQSTSGTVPNSQTCSEDARKHPARRGQLVQAWHTASLCRWCLKNTQAIEDNVPSQRKNSSPSSILGNGKLQHIKGCFSIATKYKSAIWPKLV